MTDGADDNWKSRAVVLGVVVMPVVLAVVLVGLRIKRVRENDRDSGTLMSVGMVNMADGSVLLAVERVEHRVGPIKSADLRLTAIDAETGKVIARSVLDAPMSFVGAAGRMGYFVRPDGGFRGFEAKTLLAKASSTQIIRGVPGGSKAVSGLTFDEHEKGFRALLGDGSTYFIDGDTLEATPRTLAMARPCDPLMQARVVPGIVVSLEHKSGERAWSLIARSHMRGEQDIVETPLLSQALFDPIIVVDRVSCRAIGSANPPASVLLLSRSAEGATTGELRRVTVNGQETWRFPGLSGPGPGAIVGARSRDVFVTTGTMGDGTAKVSRVDLDDGKPRWSYP